MKFLEEPVNYLASILADDLLGRVTRKRETVIADHPSSAAAKNFNLLADALMAQLHCNDVPEVI
jgi:nitrogenase subunit NifH